MVRLAALLWLILAPLALAQQASLELVFDGTENPPFAKQMVLATLKGEYDFRITLEELKVPHMPGFEWVQIENDLWTEKRVEGKNRLTLERRIALFPRHAGTLTIPPFVHQIERLDASGQRADFYVESAPVSLNVLEPPVTQGDFWLPVTALEIDDIWSTNPAELKDGELAERTVTIRALGATPQMLPAQPPLREPWLVTFTKPETRTQDLTPLGPLTTITWHWSFHAVRGEPGVLPQVTIPYFDTTRQTSDTLILAAAPFGYASFDASETAGWQSGFARFWLAPIALFAGIFITIFAALPSHAFDNTKINRWRQSRHIHKLKRTIKREAQRQNWSNVRKEIKSLLQIQGLSSSEITSALQPFDTQFFAPNPKEPVDLQALVHSLLNTRT